jgi:hypothetical protein
MSAQQVQDAACGRSPGLAPQAGAGRGPGRRAKGIDTALRLRRPAQDGPASPLQARWLAYRMLAQGCTRVPRAEGAEGPLSGTRPGRSAGATWCVRVARGGTGAYARAIVGGAPSFPRDSFDPDFPYKACVFDTDPTG